MLAKSCCSELEQTLVDKEMMIGSMKSNVEGLKEKNLVLTKKATESEEIKHGYKTMKEKLLVFFTRYILLLKQ